MIFKNFLCLFLFLAPLPGFSQDSTFLKQGRFMVGGSLNFDADRLFDNSKPDNIPSNGEIIDYNFSVKPYGGFFISDKVVIGLFLSFGRNENKRVWENETSEASRYQLSQYYGGGPTIRKYFPLKKRFGILVDSRVGLNFNEEEKYNYSSSTDWTGTWNTVEKESNYLNSSVFLSGSAGLYFFITRSFSVEWFAGNLRMNFSRINFSDKVITNNITTHKNSNTYMDFDTSINFENLFSFQNLRVNFFF